MRWITIAMIAMLFAIGGYLRLYGDEGDDRWKCPPQTFCEGGDDGE